VSASKVFGDVTATAADDLVATAEISRPPHNFFDSDLIGSIADAGEWLDGQGARAIVLCSVGKNFCAGADFTGRTGRTTDARELYAQAVRLFATPLPTVAAVQGAAVGGGLGLACAADFRVATAQTRFRANFAKIGLHHGFALTVTLPALIGQQRACELLYTGRDMGGDEALSSGLADRLAEQDTLRATARELAGQIAAAAPLAVRAIRATMRSGLADRVRAAMAVELAEQEPLSRTADFAEGVRAYAEHRPPNFQAS
jgi:enoyl-CoA hydratase/carnithine racemase